MPTVAAGGVSTRHNQRTTPHSDNTGEMSSRKDRQELGTAIPAVCNVSSAELDQAAAIRLR
jgi:hypothetical protein